MNSLAAIIRQEIDSAGPISFARFMDLALFHPVHGYYERAGSPIGRWGDFHTSVSVGGLFGELLAFQFAQWLQPENAAGSPSGEVAWGALAPCQIVEAGAHDGQLALDVLTFLSVQRPALLARLEYWVIEPSAHRRQQQQVTLRRFAPKVRWFCAWEELPAEGVRGVIFSNELLDAMPVMRLGWDATARDWFEWGVAAARENSPNTHFALYPREPERRLQAAAGGLGASCGLPPEGGVPPAVHAEGFVWRRMARKPSAEALSGAGLLELPIVLQEILPEAFTVEVCPAAVEWWQQAARALRHGRLLTLDYGFAGEQILRPERPRGTLRAYVGHRVHTDLLANPGGQDLTAQVNFTAIRQAGEAAGLTTDALVSQEQFLTGIARQAGAGVGNYRAWTPSQNRQFRTLTHPQQMGRAFHALVQSRSAARIT